MDGILSIEGVTVAGVLLAAVIALWKMNSNYAKKVQDEADKARPS